MAGLQGMSIAGAEYQIGDAIKGRWQIRQICGGRGKSGMGIVYIVDDLLCQETLAVKTLQPHLIENEMVRTAIDREANLWLAMGYHPNIVQLNYVETIGQQPYLFMDFVSPNASGQNALSQYLQEQPLDSQTISQWAIEICLGLTHMHNAGIATHRDIKPDNIMIDEAGSVRLTDFGLAVALAGVTVAQPPGDQLPGVTSMKGIVGTPGYIAPEVIQGDPATVASDIYAFGLVLVQMLTGKPWAPFTSTWQGDLLDYEQDNLRIREKLVDPAPDSIFGTIVRSCLEFEASKRFQNFTQIEQALEQVCATQNIPVSFISPQRKTVGKPSSDIDQINAIYQLGRLGEALDLVMKLRKTNADDPGLLTCEGVIRSDLGDSANALPLLQRACELSPNWCASWNNYGKALRACGRPREALQAYLKAITLDDRHSGMWSSKGNCLRNLGRFEEALSAYDKALELDGFDTAAHLGRAKAASHLDLPVEAIASLEHVFDSEPDNAGARHLYDQLIQQLQNKPEITEHGVIETSNQLYAKNRLEEGLTLLREARLRLGANTNLWNNEGVFLTDLHRYRDALRCFERALRDAPERSDLWTNKGRVYRRMQKIHEAMQCHDRAIAIDPDDIVLHTNKYACLTDLDLTDQAKNCFLDACHRATSEDDQRHCRTTSADLYYLCMGELAFPQGQYESAYKFASSVSKTSKWYQSALHVLGRAQYHLAISAFDRDIQQEPDRYGQVILLLDQAKLNMPSVEEANTVQTQINEVCRRYVNALYGHIVDEQIYTEAVKLLALIIKYSEDDELETWSRQQLAVWFTNMAIETTQQVAELRQQFINRYSPLLYNG